MHVLMPPVPATTPAHSFATSPLQTLSVTATVNTRSVQASDSAPRCDFMQALILLSPGWMPEHWVLMSPAHGLPDCAIAEQPDSSSTAIAASPDRIVAICLDPLKIV